LLWERAIVSGKEYRIISEYETSEAGKQQQQEGALPQGPGQGTKLGYREVKIYLALTLTIEETLSI